MKLVVVNNPKAYSDYCVKNDNLYKHFWDSNKFDDGLVILGSCAFLYRT